MSWSNVRNIVTTGEEDEDTVFQARSKLFVNEKGWKERGVGLLKLNVRRSDGSGARLGTLRFQNFNFHSLLKILRIYINQKSLGLIDISNP